MRPSFHALLPSPPLKVAFSLCLVTLMASGCGYFHKEPTPTDPSALLSFGREKLAEKRFSKAKEQFERLLETTSDNELRLQALINLADTFYKNGEYEEARFQYRKFLELYPVNPLAPRAQFQLAMCSFAEIKTPDRDQAITLEAIRQFERFLQSYPDHPLASEAEQRHAFCINRLAEHDLEVADFYYKRGKYHSAINRLSALLDRYPDFTQNDKALYLLGQSYKQEESREKARAAFARLVNEHPDSGYASSAKRTLRKWRRKGG